MIAGGAGIVQDPQTTPYSARHWPRVRRCRPSQNNLIGAPFRTVPADRDWRTERFGAPHSQGYDLL
jgi:hypothetical protein